MRKQTRRSISVRSITYQRLYNFCMKHGKTISGYVEEIVAERLDHVQEPVPTVIDKPKPRVTGDGEDLVQADIDKIISAHFTF